MFRWLFVILSVFFSTRALSQVIQPVYNLTINDITFSNENFGIAAGSLGRVLVTTDGGNYWKLVQPEVAQKRNLTTTYISPFGHLYVGGAKGLLMKSTDQGQTWTSINLPVTTTISVESVGFFNPQVGVVVLSEYSQHAAYLTQDGGQNWTMINNGEGVSHDIMIVNDTTAFYLTTHQIKKTTDQGKTWTISADNGWYSYQAFRAGDFISSTTGYVMENSVPWKTQDGGATWTKLNSVLPEGDGYDLDFITEQVGFYSSGYGIYKTLDGGMTWNKVFTQPNGPRLAPFHFFTESTGIAAGWGNTDILFNTQNGGAEWTVSIGRPHYTHKSYQSSSYPDYRQPMNSFLQVQSSTDLMMVNRDSLFWYSDNGGIYFYPRTVGTHDLNSIYFVNTQLGFVAGEKGSVYKTTDGGQTWHLKSTGTNKDLLKITFSDTQQGIAVGSEGTVLVTTNGGETWQDVSLPSQNYIISMAGILNSNQLYAGDGGGMYVSTNEGTSWDYFPKLWYTYQQTDMYVTDAQKIQYLYGPYGQFGYTTDGGPNTPTSQLFTINGANLGGSIGEEMASIDFRGQIGYAAGYRFITRTGDLGKTWNTLYIGSDAELEAIRMANDTVAFAYGEADFSYQNLYKISCDVSAIDVTGEFSGVCDKEYTYSIASTGMNTSSVQATYTITGGTVISQTGSSIKVKWNMTGSRELRAVLVAKNCKTKKEIVRTITTVDQLPETIEIHGKKITCAGDEAYEVLNNDPSKAYVWSLSNGNGAQFLTSEQYYKINVRWANATNATLSVTVYSFDCLGKTIANPIKVVSTPPAKVTSINGLKEVCSTEATQQYSITVQEGVTYQWIATGGTVLSSSGNKATVAWGEGFPMTLSVKPVLACMEGETTTIDILSRDKDWFEDADGDGFGNPVVSLQACSKPVQYVDNNFDCDDTDPALTPENNCELITGVEKNAGGKITIYPNPCPGLCELSNPDDISTVAVADSQGRTFENLAFQGGVLDASSLPAGFYILIATKKNGQTTRTKFIVSR